MSKIKKISGVYAIKNIVNDKVYIGHSVNIKKRWSAHRSMLRHNKHGNKQLQEDYNNQIESDFVYIILRECLQRDLPIFEEQYKAEYGDNIYNKNNVITDKKKIRRGKEAKNFKEKWSKQNTGENNPHCTKFNVPIIKEIKKAILDGESISDLALKYQTSENYIYQIHKGNKWKNVSIELEMAL